MLRTFISYIRSTLIHFFQLRGYFCVLRTICYKVGLYISDVIHTFLLLKQLNVEAVEEFDVGFYSRSDFVKVDKLVGCVRARGASRTEFDRLPRHESLVA